jgi:hypothetical protein
MMRVSYFFLRLDSSAFAPNVRSSLTAKMLFFAEEIAKFKFYYFLTVMKNTGN